MIAYHFPPIQGSSGVHRTVQFARHLPKFDWEPLIVTVHPRAYPGGGKDMLGGLPESVVIKRAQAFDSARHFSFRNRYLDLTAVPDRWITWWFHGVFSCLKLIKKYKPSIIWSTFPIASAHLIALTVQRLTGLPWIADFRDPMIQETQPEPGITRKAYQWIEQKTIEHASSAAFVTQSALAHHAKAYPHKNSDFWQLIENGYDESLFQLVEGNPDKVTERKKFKLVHSGILYSKGRNPIPLFEALKAYSQNGTLPVELILRGAGTQIDLEQKVASMGLEETVKIEPSVSYDKAILEMVKADALVLFQGAEFNRQIPAKVYEYIRSGRPILALINDQGETCSFLKKWSGVYFADIDSSENIERTLKRVFIDITEGRKIVRHHASVYALSRESGAVELARILDSLAKREKR